jgi:hypothetical protein
MLGEHLKEVASPVSQWFLCSLKRDFPSHPLTWDALARRPWVGVDPTTLKGVYWCLNHSSMQ